MTRKKRDRNKLMESYPGAKKGNRNASIHGAEGKDGRPFWEVLWDYCCCSEAFWRRRYLERLEGTYLCDDKESMRYQNLIDQNKNVTIKSELPEGSVMLREDEPKRQPLDQDRLQYRVDTAGMIFDAFYG